MNYYNEFEPKAAAWLQELINAGHIPDGYVDTRSIVDVRPSDLAGFTQCHFFAGIGVWSYALGLAGWPTDRPVWTGSCPCQPFSAAGKGDGFADERHLWPHFHHLIRVCRPPVVLGEQVASKDGLAWLDLVATDLEGEGYAAGAADLCAAGVGAPHIRQRLYWVAHADSSPGREGRALIQGRTGGGDAQRGAGSGGVGVSGGLADAEQHDHRGEVQATDHVGPEADGPADRAGGCGGSPGGLADHNDPGLSRFAGLRLQRANFHDADGRSPVSGFWAGADWLPCRDNKWRPVEPGTFPLADGAPARVGRLRGYGNAIVAQCAQAFIETVMDVTA